MAPAFLFPLCLFTSFNPAMATHRADASSFLDNRGYSGPLVRGVNPVTLFEKAVRDRITDSYYWKEQCFGLNAATLCDRAGRIKLYWWYLWSL